MGCNYRFLYFKNSDRYFLRFLFVFFCSRNQRDVDLVSHLSEKTFRILLELILFKRKKNHQWVIGRSQGLVTTCTCFQPPHHHTAFKWHIQLFSVRHCAIIFLFIFKSSTASLNPMAVREPTSGYMSLLPVILGQFCVDSDSQVRPRWLTCCVCVWSGGVGGRACLCSWWHWGQTQYNSCQWTAAVSPAGVSSRQACTDSLAVAQYQQSSRFLAWQPLLFFNAAGTNLGGGACMSFSVKIWLTPLRNSVLKNSWRSLVAHHPSGTLGA